MASSLPFGFTFSLSTLSNLFPNFSFFVQPSQTFSTLTHLGRSSSVCDKGRKGSPANSFTSPLLLTSLSESANQRTESDSFASSANQAHRLPALNPCIPEIRFASQISSSPASRRASIETWSTNAKLGFCVAGLEVIFGPLLLHMPKPTSSTSISNELKSRSVTSFILSTCSKCLDRFQTLNGRRLHLREESPWLLWFYNHIMRTLVLELYVANTYEPKSLTVYILFTILICRRDEFDYRVSMPNYYASTNFSKDFKHRSNVTTTLLKIWKEPLTLKRLKPRSGLIFMLQTGYKLCVELLNLHGRRGLHARENPPVMLRSCTYSLRILAIIAPSRTLSLSLAINLNHWSNIIFAQTLVKALFCVVLLVPARSTSLAPSSTPFRLLTLANQSSIDLLLEDLLIILDLTCIKKLHSFWFKALKKPLSTFSFYHFISLMLALGNALSCCILNFGISDSSYLCPWFLL